MTLNVHLQQLAYLREVTRCQSWSEAASNLHVTQPALSQSLRELEGRVGVALFERVGRRQRLTAMGEELAHFASSILARAEAFEGRLEALRRGRTGLLRVGMVDAACLYVLPGALRAFQHESPDVELQLAVEPSALLLQKLRDFDLDLAVVVGPVQSDELRATLVTEEPLQIYRPANERVPGGGPAHASWILYPSGSHTRRLIDVALARQGIVPRVTIESNNPQVLRQMVSMGFGWGVLPRAVAEEDEGLRPHGDEPLVIRPLQAVTRADAPEDPRVTRLLELATAPG